MFLLGVQERQKSSVPTNFSEEASVGSLNVNIVIVFLQ